MSARDARRGRALLRLALARQARSQCSSRRRKLVGTFLKPLLLALPLERAPRELDLGLRHDGLDWLARTDPADDRDRRRIARLAQIDPDKVTRRGAAALEARAHG